MNPTSDIDLSPVEQQLASSLDRLGTTVGPVTPERRALDRRLAVRRRRRHARQATAAVLGVVAVVSLAVLADRDAPTQVDAADDPTPSAPSTTTPATENDNPMDWAAFQAAFADMPFPDADLCRWMSAVTYPADAPPPVDPVLAGATMLQCDAAGGWTEIAAVPEGDGPGATAATWEAHGASVSEVALADGSQAFLATAFGPYNGGIAFDWGDVEVRIYGDPSGDELVAIASSLHAVTEEDFLIGGTVEEATAPGPVVPATCPDGSTGESFSVVGSSTIGPAVCLGETTLDGVPLTTP